MIYRLLIIISMMLSTQLYSSTSLKDSTKNSKYGTFSLSAISHQSYLFNKTQSPRILKKDEFKLNPQFGAGISFYTTQLPLELSIQFTYGTYFRYRQGGRYKTYEHDFIKGVEHTQTGEVFRWNYSVGYIFKFKKSQLIIGVSRSRLRTKTLSSNRLDILMDESIVVVDEGKHTFKHRTRITSLGLCFKYTMEMSKTITPFVLFDLAFTKTRDYFIMNDHQSYLNNNIAGICLGLNIKLN